MSSQLPTPPSARIPRLRKQLLAVVDSRTTMVCLDAAGQIAELDDDFDTLAGPYAAPPFHIHCRSIAVPYAPGLIRVQRDAANAEIRLRPGWEKRKGPDGYMGPIPPPAPASAATQVMRPRPDMRPPAPGARVPGTHRDHIKGWAPHLARLGRGEANRGDMGRDPVLDDIARVQRFDAAPRVVREGQLARLLRRDGAVEIWRGVTGHGAADYAEELRTGTYLATSGIHGAGLQFTTVRSDAMAFGAGGVLLHAVLVPEARTITWEELEDLVKATQDALSATERRRYRVILGDPGRLAAALGYDAILLPDGNVLVLNRTALVVAREP